MKAIKVILLGLAALVVILIIFAIPMIRTILSFSPAPTGAITPEFLAVKDSFVNLFILKSGDKLICFDAGNNPRGVEKGFKELGLDPLRVKAVFLTHSDGDHANGLSLFSNAVVYLPEMEEPLVNGTAKRHFLFIKATNRLPVTRYTLIKDGETVKFGQSTVKAILTPGHTPGSTSYVINGKYLAVGDLAIIKEGKLVGMPKPPSEEPNAVEESLKLVNEISSIDYIATAHGGVVKQ